MKQDTHPVDLHVGQRLRERRMLLGISQLQLAQMLGLSYQQIQKYERGHNRVSASRLAQFADILGVHAAYFFDGMPKGLSGVGGEAENPDVAADLSNELGLTRQAASILREFLAIKDPELRQAMRRLMKFSAQI